MVRQCRQLNLEEEYENTLKYWRDMLKNARQLKTGDENIDALYNRSLWYLS